MTAKRFEFSGHLMTHLGRHGVVRSALLGAALVGNVMGDLNIGKSQMPGESAGTPTAAVLQAVGAIRQDAAALVSAANAAAAAKGVAGTCFGAQLDGKFVSAEVQQRVEAATIYLVSITDGKSNAVGTGTVIHGSGHRVLTASHVAELEKRPNTSFQAYSSTGQLLGDVSLVAEAGSRDGYRGGWNWKGHLDQAVLDVTPRTDDSRKALDSIRGLDLAPQQADGNLNGIFGSDTMAGTNPGHSGAALVDAAGQVHGSLTSGGMVFDGYSGSVDLKQPMMEKLVAGQNPTGTITAMRMTDSGFVGVSDPAVLGALGDGGRGVEVVDLSPLEDGGKTPVFIAGYSLFGCRASEGHMGVDELDDLPGVSPRSEIRARINVYDDIAKLNEAIRMASQAGLHNPGAPVGARSSVSAAGDQRPPKAAFFDPQVASCLLVGRDGSISAYGSDGALMGMIPSNLPPDQSALSWNRPSRSPDCTAAGKAGTYTARLKPEKSSLDFTPYGSGQVRLVATISSCVGQEAGVAENARYAASRHDAVMSMARDAGLTEEVSFTVTFGAGGAKTEAVRLGGKIGFPPGLGPAVRMTKPDGTTEEGYLYRGTRLGKAAGEAMAAFSELFPGESPTASQGVTAEDQCRSL